jgi:flagellar protein FliO/FliZ
LLVLFALAWLLKRTKNKRSQGGAIVRVVGGVALGARERVVVVEIANRWIVVGVSSGRMSALANLDAGAVDSLSAEASGDSKADLPKDFSSIVQKVVNE